MTHPTEDEIDAEIEYRRQYQKGNPYPSIGSVMITVALLLILIISIIFL